MEKRDLASRSRSPIELPGRVGGDAFKLREDCAYLQSSTIAALLEVLDVCAQLFDLLALTNKVAQEGLCHIFQVAGTRPCDCWRSISIHFSEVACRKWEAAAQAVGSKDRRKETAWTCAKLPNQCCLILSKGQFKEAMYSRSRSVPLRWSQCKAIIQDLTCLPQLGRLPVLQ